jgi:hypothetical protein
MSNNCGIFKGTKKRYAVFKRAEVKNENDDATGNN